MKRSLAALVKIAIVLALASPIVYSQMPATPRPTPTSTTSSTSITTIQQLAEIADSLEIKATIRERINPPVFLITQDAFVFYEGSMPRLGDNVITPQSFPILIPLARKLQVDDLRQLVREHPEANTVGWQNAFKMADAIIQQKMLATIASGTLSGDQLTAKLNEYNGYITDVFQETALEFATAQNLKLRRPGLLDVVTHTVPVKFVLNPKEGQLEVLPKYLFNSQGSFDKAWRPILETEPHLGGDYYFRVKWPDGTLTSPKPLKVERAGQVFEINQN